MKKICLLLFLMTSIGFSQTKKGTTYKKQTTKSNQKKSNSTDAISKGTWLVEANTGTGQTGQTSFSYNEDHYWSVGAEAGYFIIDNLALKAGFGYGEIKGLKGEFNYKVGAKYYILGKIPVASDFTGTSSDGTTRSWIGLQGGYAWFVAKNVAIEPALRYNILVSDSPGHKSFMQAKIGFSIFF